MSGEPTIDCTQFQSRLRQLLDLWREQSAVPSSSFFEVKSFLVFMGSGDDDNPYQKTAALHTWLLGYEFPATLLLMTLSKIIFITSENKAKFLGPLRKESVVPIEIVCRSKDDKTKVEQLKVVLEEIKSGTKVGLFAKDKYKGKVIEEWSAMFDKEAHAIEKVDLSAAVSPCMSIKDANEVGHIRAASKASVAVLNDFFVERMSSILDKEKKVTHSALAEQVERVLEQANFVSKIKVGPNFDPDQLEWCYTPIIQSGGQYDLKPSAMSDDEFLHGGVILCSLGLRYKSYCSNIGRTYLIDPTGSQTKYYEFLVVLQQKVFASIKDGVAIKDVYKAAVDQIRSDFPELEAKFTKNIGNGIGIDFRDTSLILNSKNDRLLLDGMTLNISIGFHELEQPKGKDKRSTKYSLLLVDTIRVRKDTIECLTDTPKSKVDVSYFFNDEEESKPKQKAARPVDSSVVLPKKTRGVARPVNETDEQKRKEHQKLLAAKLQEDGLARYPEGGQNGDAAAPMPAKKFEAYRRANQLPSSINSLKIVVDQRNQSVIVPIYGRPVPLHINTIKNVSKNDEGEFVYLRINLLTPGQVTGKKDDHPFQDETANFIRSLTFRSSDVDRMSDITKEIQEMKKNASKKEAERRELADVVEQDSLMEVKSKFHIRFAQLLLTIQDRRPQKLLDVYVRPGLDGKRVTGELEIQQNGLRYQSPVRSDHRIDILFNNIRHLFFQPCDNELMVIIHVNLRNPIMIGKKKAKDIQFYREASEVQFDETANRKRKYKYGDEDELEAEQDERRRRAQLNKEFKNFAEKMSEAVSRNTGRSDPELTLP